MHQHHNFACLSTSNLLPHMWLRRLRQLVNSVKGNCYYYCVDIACGPNWRLTAGGWPGLAINEICCHFVAHCLIMKLYRFAPIYTLLLRPRPVKAILLPRNGASWPSPFPVVNALVDFWQMARPKAGATFFSFHFSSCHFGFDLLRRQCNETHFVFFTYITEHLHSLLFASTKRIFELISSKMSEDCECEMWMRMWMCWDSLSEMSDNPSTSLTSNTKN